MVHAICLLRIHPRKHAGAGDNALYIKIRAVEPMERSDELRQGASAGRSRVNVHNGRIPTQNQIARRAVWAAGFQGEHSTWDVGVNAASGDESAGGFFISFGHARKGGVRTEDLKGGIGCAAPGTSNGETGFADSAAVAFKVDGPGQLLIGEGC